jgi:RAD50-interacting protein 1
MSKVQSLDVATRLLELVAEAQLLTSTAQDALKTDPRSALRSYKRLEGLLYALRAAQPEAEGGAPQLVAGIESQASTVHQQLQTALTSAFKTTLDKIKWPQRELLLDDGLSSAWTDQVQLLLELQEPDLIHRAANRTDAVAEPAILLPLEVMVQPLAQRFRYHFYGDRPTNRLDKPEYFLSHIFELLDRHSSFMTEALQPVLDARVHASDDLELVYTDAVSCFISALLPLVMTKSQSILPQLSSHPQLLSHFVHELMSFDATLRDSWAYNPLPGVYSEWKGLTWSIMVTHNYFNTWLGVEKQFAFSRYKAILQAADARELDYEGVASTQTKPTKATVRVNDLLETITDRYRSLSSFSQKMKFLIDVQLSIFDDYHNHLHESLQVYLASSHTAGRLLQGQSKSEAFSEKGLASLSKVYGSAEFLERKMSDWGDDLFFLELWEELQDRARTNADGSNGSLGRDLRVDQVASKTSSTIKNGHPDAALETEGGALFDETANAYRRLKTQCETEILRLLDINVHDAVVPFAQVDAWASLSASISNPADLAPSSALDSILQTISIHLGFLSKALAPAPMRKMIKHFCSTLQTDLYENVLLRHTFSAAGVSQLIRDVKAIESAIDSTCHTRNAGASGLRKLNQALTLLGLPVKPSAARHLPSHAEDVDEDVDEDAWGLNDENEDESSLDGNGYGNDWSLWAAERAVFESNEAARRALGEMGLELLSESEARNVLKRRVEISS